METEIFKFKKVLCRYLIDNKVWSIAVEKEDNG